MNFLESLKTSLERVKSWALQTFSLRDVIKDTTQVVTFDANHRVSTIQHKDKSGNVLRTDSFTYGANEITETRTLANGETLVLKTNLTTLTTEVK